MITRPRFKIINTLDKNIYRILILLTVTLAVYYPVLNAHFLHFDDLGMLQWLSNPYNPPTIKGFFLSGAGSRYYRPLLLTSFLFDQHIWQQEAAGYHLTNYLLHAANALLLYFILSKLAAKFDFNNKQLPLIGSLLFALHPLTCESVAWISGRTDVLAAFFCLAAFLLYQHNSKVGVIICFLLGLLSKESALSLIPVIGLADFGIRRLEGKTIRQALFSSLSWQLTMLASLLFYLWLRTGGFFSLDAGIKKSLSNNVSSELSATTIRNSIGGLINYSVELLAAVGFYFKKLFIPFPLNFAIYRINSEMYLLLSALIFIAAIYMALKKKFSFLLWTVLLGAGCAPGLLIATSNMAWMPFAERYLYFAAAIWATAIVFAYDWADRFFPNAKKITAGLVVVVICLWGTTTFLRTSTWHDDSTLWAAAYESAPNSGKIMYKFGIALISKGNKEAGLKMIKEAVKVIKDNKWRAYALDTLGDQAAFSQDFVTAGKRYDEALTANPGNVEHAYLAAFLANLPSLDPKSKAKNIIQAVKHYRAAYRIKHNPFYLYQAAKLLTKISQQQAIELYRKIITSYPGSQEAIFARRFLLNINRQSDNHHSRTLLLFSKAHVASMTSAGVIADMQEI